MRRIILIAGFIIAVLIISVPMVSASTSMTARSAMPMSASGCIVLRPGSINGGVCINVNGSGQYVNYVDAGNWVPTCCSVTGYYVVKTMWPAANSFSYTTRTYTCPNSIVGHRCWAVRIWIQKTLGLYPHVPEGMGGYLRAQQICVYFHSGGKQYGPACELVY